MTLFGAAMLALGGYVVLLIWFILEDNA